MSTSTNDESNKVASEEYVETLIAAAIVQFNKAREGELATITNLSQRLAVMEENVSKLVQVLSQPQQQEPAPVPQAPRQKIDFAEIIQAVREGASAYKEVKSASAGESSELDRWGAAFAEIARRESLAAMKLNVRRALRKGVVDTGTIENIVGETIDRAAGADHQPIL